MKRVDILLVDSKTTKLTIATDRISIKLSNALNDEDREAIKLFLLTVVEDIPTDVGYTVRGDYRDYTNPEIGVRITGIKMKSSDVAKSWEQWFPHVKQRDTMKE